MIRKVLSGGQTGVDRAALDVARSLGIPIGGWCPRGGWAEDGVVLGIGGPRESEQPGVYASAVSLLRAVLGATP